MSKIYTSNNSIIFENNYAQVTVSAKDGTVEKIIDKQTGKDIKSEASVQFISLWADEKTPIAFKSLSLNGEVITAEFENGKFDVEVKTFDNYFTFEVISDIPSGTFRAFIANMKYEYDYTDKANTGAVGVAMTIAANPVYFPNGYAKETVFYVYPKLEDIGAKYGLVIAPLNRHREILKELYLTVDKTKGIVSTTGGAFSKDDRRNFSNYIIQADMTTKYIKENLEFFKEIGVEQLDFHKDCTYTFRQGDFKFYSHDSAKQYKEEVADMLEKEGIITALHTYSHYISYEADTILTLPENQKQIKVHEYFTLADDMTADADFVPTLENTDHITDEYLSGLEIPFVLIDEEIIKVSRGKDGFKIAERGCAATKVTAHKKGTEVRYLEGFYNGFCPEMGSELFLQIARNTAKAYNEGGFKMIYLDAFDGIRHHCDIHHEYWYYAAMFIRELLNHCDSDPILEQAAFNPSYWASRGRAGAWDICRRGYKPYNNWHSELNQPFIDSHNTPTMGWYSYYPINLNEHGNVTTKYEHFDDIDHLGALAVMYDYSTVFNGLYDIHMKEYPAMRRNVALYKKYDELRRSQYFTEEYREKLKACPHEVALIEKRGKKYSFVEKSYTTAKLYDLNDSARNTAVYKNPFGQQLPFIRIEALFSTLGNNPMILLPLDETKELTAQNLAVDFGGYLNLTDLIAKKVRIFGNGKGGKIFIEEISGPRGPKTQKQHKYAGYIIDIDFKGWREFTLIETDNGERTDHGFEKNKDGHYVYRQTFRPDLVFGCKIHTEGDMEGVRMSSLTACEHTFDVLKNPTVTVGDTAIMFECELMSSDYIEYDGKEAKVIDRYGNEKKIWFTTNLKAPRGKFKATLTAQSLNRVTPRAQLTFGFTGKEIK